MILNYSFLENVKQKMQAGHFQTVSSSAPLNPHPLPLVFPGNLVWSEESPKMNLCPVFLLGVLFIMCVLFTGS